jgi:hypothetical protein
MVNLIEDERALQSCSTTNTSLSVSRSAGSGVLSHDLLLWRRSGVSGLQKDRLFHSIFSSAKPKDYLLAFEV